ncbi:MAG: AmmeMemoRadiSam system protein B [Clostridiales bacterium]|nr:AmmeMemoRadiSam system protein B [Clostridiales bacterium]
MIKLKALGPVIMIIISLIGYSSDDHIHLNTPVYEGAEIYEEVALNGMIVPHHLVPLDKLEAMYLTASSDEVKRILLISPDHLLNEYREMITSDKNWRVDGGQVQVDLDLLNQLLNDGIKINNAEVGVEHGLNTHIPFIKKYFPNATVVPIAISKQTDFQHLNELIVSIPEDVFLIASIDFSHYMDLETANLKDEWTKNTIRNGNFESFFKMGDDYFDSPGCLYVISCFARKNSYELKFYDHSNSAYYMGEDIPETTSYFFVGLK